MGSSQLESLPYCEPFQVGGGSFGPISLAPTAASNIYKPRNTCLAPDFWHIGNSSSKGQTLGANIKAAILWQSQQLNSSAQNTLDKKGFRNLGGDQARIGMLLPSRSFGGCMDPSLTL